MASKIKLRAGNYPGKWRTVLYHHGEEVDNGWEFEKDIKVNITNVLNILKILGFRQSFVEPYRPF